VSPYAIENSALLILLLQTTLPFLALVIAHGAQKRASPLVGIGKILIGAESGALFRGGARQRAERTVLPLMSLFWEANWGTALEATLKETPLA
jgi:hypothetical protein